MERNLEGNIWINAKNKEKLRGSFNDGGGGGVLTLLLEVIASLEAAAESVDRLSRLSDPNAHCVDRFPQRSHRDRNQTRMTSGAFAAAAARCELGERKREERERERE